MKRHPALVPLSHDHHHTLVRARELRRTAATGDAAALEAACARFRRVFAGEVARHFRDEEELVFPLLAAAPGPLPGAVVRAASQHARIRALVPRLPDRDAAAELGALLEEHVRLEERELFPLVEECAAAERLAALQLPERAATEDVVDLLAGDGPGPVWGCESDDLNATLLVWPEGGGADEHVNAERDVLVVAIAGSGTIVLDGGERSLGTGTAVLVEKGRARRIEAGPAGLRYLTVHKRRRGLQVAPRTNR